MKLREVDIRDIQKMDNRVTAYKERLFTETHRHDPKSYLISSVLAGIFIAITILLTLAIIFQ